MKAILAASAVLAVALSAGRESAPSAFQADSTETLLDRATASVAEMEDKLSAVVMEERYEQTSVGRLSGRTQVTRADLLLIRLPGQDSWVPFRDVYEVDGQAVRDRADRLQRLFLERPGTAMDEAAAITRESSRYNIGNITRTINTPTFPLMLLRADYRKRMEFKPRRAAETSEGQGLIALDFKERSRPTIVRSAKGDDVLLEGTFWMDAGGGSVRKALVKTRDAKDPAKNRNGAFTFMDIPPSGQTTFWVQVSYAREATLGVFVPVEMTESGVTSAGAAVEGKATYSNCRRFQVMTSETFKPVKTP